METFPQRLRALAARIRRPKPAAGPAPDAAVFNEPPIFPAYGLLAPSTELAVAADALADPTPAPRRADAENPFNHADATLHIGDTVVPVKSFALDATWEPLKPEPGRTIVGVDGDVIVTGTLATDGTITVQSTTTVEPPRPPRRTQPPDRCPCTAIYSICRCPDRR